MPQIRADTWEKRELDFARNGQRALLFVLYQLDDERLVIVGVEGRRNDRNADDQQDNNDASGDQGIFEDLGHCRNLKRGDGEKN